MNLKVFANISLVTILVFFNIINRSESVSCDTPPKNTEARLQQRLFCNYDKEVRPISNSKNVTIVKLVMYLKSFEYSEYGGTITLNSWMTMKWYDEHLKWNKREFDNIDTLTVHSEDIWKPDLTVYHSESTQYDEACSASHCDLQYDGHISCIPPCSHSGFCNADYINWPFDVQKCVLNMGTWMHKGSEVNFQAEKVVIEKKGEKSNEWKLTSIKSTNLRGNYSCCPNETYPSVKFTVVIERFSAAEETYIVAPALIFCVVNLIIVWLNPVCTERITLAIVSMFLHVMLIQQLSWLVPKNGNAVPKALIYFRDSLVIGAFLLLDTVIKKGLLACQADTPSWVKSTTSTLRGNKFGQLMFTNPYLINQAPLDNDALITDERINSIEEQPTESSPKKEERNIWFIVVRVLDTLTFLILVLVYLIMIFGWIPTAKTIPEDVIGDVIVEDE